MYVILITIHIVIATMLVGLILIQHGKGAQAGAAFGSGASQTVFGSQGSGGFLSRATGILAAIFFLLNLFLVFYINRVTHKGFPVESSKEVPYQSEEKKGAPPTDIPE